MTQLGIHRAGFRWAEVFLYAAIGLGPLGLAVSSSAQARPARYAIEAAQVTRAMDVASLPTDGVEVKLAAPVTSLTANARVRVESVAYAGAHEVRMRLACSDHAQCVPFFATAKFSDAVDAAALNGVRAPQAALKPSPAAVEPVAATVKSASASDAVHAGAPATLEMDEDRIHIRLEVICLQGGVAGNRIRVSSLDHKQIYTAEVVTPTLLKGEFQK